MSLTPSVQTYIDLIFNIQNWFHTRYANTHLIEWHTSIKFGSSKVGICGFKNCPSFLEGKKENLSHLTYDVRERQLFWGKWLFIIYFIIHYLSKSNHSGLHLINYYKCAKISATVTLCEAVARFCVYVYKSK